MSTATRAFLKDSEFPPLFDYASGDPDAGGKNPHAARGSDAALSLRQDLASVFGSVDGILKELERAKAALGQRTAALSGEREAHHEIKGRHKTLAVHNDKLSAELASLQVEHGLFKSQAGELETANSSLQQALAEKARTIADLTRRTQADIEKHTLLAQDINAARALHQSAETRTFQLESELASARDAIAIADAETAKRDTEIADLRQHLARVSRALEETEELLASGQTRLGELTADLESKHNEQVATFGLLQAESDGRRSEVAAMQDTVDELARRAADFEQANAELSHSLQDRLAERGELDALVAEQQTRLDAAGNALQAAQTEIAALRKQSEERDTAGAAHAAEAERLTGALQTREKESSSWKYKFEAANEKIRLEMQKHDSERSALSQQLARLAAQLEQEQLARSLAETALAAARKERPAMLRAKPIRQTPPALEQDLVPPNAAE